MYLARAVLALVLGAGAGALWGFGGVIAVEVAVLLAIAGAARRRWLPAVRVWRPRLEETRWLLSRGSSLMVANLIVVGATVVDRVYVAAVLPDELGQYVFATIVVTAWVALSGILTQALAPKYLFEHGAGAPLRAVRGKALRVVSRGLVGGALMLPLLLLALAAARRGAYADYRAGLDLMPILYLGGLLNLLAFPGFVLAALRPSLATAAAAAGAAAASTPIRTPIATGALIPCCISTSRVERRFGATVPRMPALFSEACLVRETRVRNRAGAAAVSGRWCGASRRACVPRDRVRRPRHPGPNRGPAQASA
jgi:hypothetical protein